MSNQQYHKKKSEELLLRIHAEESKYGGDLTAFSYNKVSVLVRVAQVHATLATIREDDE